MNLWQPCSISYDILSSTNASLFRGYCILVVHFVIEGFNQHFMYVKSYRLYDMDYMTTSPPAIFNYNYNIDLLLSKNLIYPYVANHKHLFSVLQHLMFTMWDFVQRSFIHMYTDSAAHSLCVHSACRLWHEPWVKYISTKQNAEHLSD